MNDLIKRDYVLEIIEELVSRGEFTLENMMMSINALPNTSSLTEKRETMGQYDLMLYRGKSLMFWALEWFRMSNDTFYDLYGFNFNPHSYPGLYQEARERI